MKKIIRMVAVVILAVALAPAAQAQIITGETASATTEHSPRLAIDAVNDAGITINSPDLVTDGQITHDQTAGDMWMTQSSPPVTAGRALGQQLTVDLGANYDLDGMRIWNFNEAGGGNDTGIKYYDMEISSDGSSWSTPAGFSNVYLDIARNNDGVYTALNLSNVSHVRYTILDTWRQNDDVGGLSEVMFSGVESSGPGATGTLIIGR